MTDSKDFALITGASAGIGVAYAERLAREGRPLVLVARRKDRLDALAARLRQESKVDIEVLRADLTAPADLRAVEQRVSRGDIGLLINNAGIGGYGPFAQLPIEMIDGLIDLHVRAMAHLTRAALPPMLAKKAGAVINVASLLALSATLPPNPIPHRATYAAAKAFMLAFTQTLSHELTGTGVQVQICLPGLVATEFHGEAGKHLAARAMSATDVVQASITALARGEGVCVPGLDDPSLVDKVGEAQRAVMGAANRPAMASRYK